MTKIEWKKTGTGSWKALSSTGREVGTVEAYAEWFDVMFAGDVLGEADSLAGAKAMVEDALVEAHFALLAG